MKRKTVRKTLGLVLAGIVAASSGIQPVAGFPETEVAAAADVQDGPDASVKAGRAADQAGSGPEAASREDSRNAGQSADKQTKDSGEESPEAGQSGGGLTEKSEGDGQNAGQSGDGQPQNPADDSQDAGQSGGGQTGNLAGDGQADGESGTEQTEDSGQEGQLSGQPETEQNSAAGENQSEEGDEAGQTPGSAEKHPDSGETGADQGTGENSGAGQGTDENSGVGQESESSAGQKDTGNSDGTEKDTEAETETDEAKASGKAQLSVSGADGTAFSVTWLKTPSAVECQGRTLPVDYADGVCLVTVPEGTEEIRVSVKQLTGISEEDASSELFFSRWGGYFTEADGQWKLYPDFLDEDTAVYAAAQMQRDGVTVYQAGYENETYTLPLEKFMQPEGPFTLEQQAVYGRNGSEGSYAELCVGSFRPDGSRQANLLLLVEFVKNTTEESEIPPALRADGEKETESVIEDAASAAELLSGEADITETELVSETLQATYPANASASEIQQAYTDAGKNLADSAKEYIPQVSSINGEWQILGLARSGQAVDSSVYALYKANVVSTLAEKNGILHEKKYTEYSRVILALTALGEDVTDVGGYNLLEPLADYDQTVWQGINGAIFALIALDSHGYEIPAAPAGKTQNSREKLIQCILYEELSGGGWSLSGAADVDVTAMAIQAFAPYYGTNPEVKAAVDRALAKLSSVQNTSGGFSSYGNDNSESCAQVLVALTALGIDPQTDARFIKNGKTVLDALLCFSTSDGAFEHTAGTGADQMATEQAYYALTAYQRFLKGENSLYDMSDVLIKSDLEKVAEAEALIDMIPSVITLNASQTVKAALAYYNGLNSSQKAAVNADKVSRLQKAAAQLEKLEEAAKDTQTEKNAGTAGSPAGNKNTGTSGAGSKQPGGSTKSVSLVSGTKSGGTGAAGKTSGSFGATAGASARAAGALGKTGAAEGGSGKTGGTAGEAGKKTETEAEQAETVIRKMNLLFLTTWKRKRLPEDASEYTEQQIEAVAEVYQEYEDLDAKGKALVEAAKRYPDYQEALRQMGEVNHYDEVTGVDMRENQEETLPWYIRIVVDPQLLTEEEEQEIRSILGADSELYGLNDIHFESLLGEEEWEPEGLVRVRLPMIDLGACESAVVLHVLDDGSVELLEGRISGQELVFEAAEFSRYGIAGIMGTLEDLMKGQAQQGSLWIWLVPGAGAAALLLLLVIVRIACTRKKKGVRDCEG